MQLLSLPQELIFLIADQSRPADVLHLSQANRFLCNILLRYLRKRDVNSTGGMALSFYSYWGYEAQVKEMLDAGAQVDIQNPRWRDSTPLVLAISRHHVSVAQLLLARGANVNFFHLQAYGRTPLETAILCTPLDDLSMIELLLDRGADINFKGYKSRTPLFTAVMPLIWGQEDLNNPDQVDASCSMIRFLIDRGADVNAQDSEGRTPIALNLHGNQQRRQCLIEGGAWEERELH
ncbi:ankyrin repeat-containing domain protein [Penicillium argentinense]|uniref:Ankyrin repeat-containing domain protein n=1 Tax=Penicillium argentinense TaxID=1131581 RepID=A0A9W9EJV7_9EURO|nr:ankyrin repeat-containing domain protein [Penicillium argentinense]KAJ5083060.1 ankyrin repeat-containing domain protein [Penicillium argentinense]